MTNSPPLVRRLQVSGFRSARDLTLEPNAVCALVGEARAGKSNVLAALRAALDPGATAAVTQADIPHGQQRIHVRATLAGGEAIEIDGAPPQLEALHQDDAPPVLLLSADERTRGLVAEPRPTPAAGLRALELFTQHLRSQLEHDAPGRTSDSSAALSMIDAIEACCEEVIDGVVLLIEEPELYLAPQAQRYLYRLMRRFAAGGNQVIYSTHSPAFLNVARLDELVFVERPDTTGSLAVAPRVVTPDEDFRVLSEFDAERAELFLARTVMLVEGLTEKLAMPFVFAAIGTDADAAGISIVECGGKGNIPLFARVCVAAGIPYVVLHDRDARRGRSPSRSEKHLNRLIEDVAGPERVVALEPDFEGVARLPGRSRKPRQAWRDFSQRSVDTMPTELTRAAQITAELARSGARRGHGEVATRAHS